MFYTINLQRDIFMHNYHRCSRMFFDIEKDHFLPCSTDMVVVKPGKREQRFQEQIENENNETFVVSFIH